MMNLFKRIISGCLVLCMLLVQFPVLAAAEETAGGWGTPNGWGTPGNWFENSGTSSIFDQVPSFGVTSMFAAARSGGAITALTVGCVDALANPQGEGYSFDAETATLTLNGFRYENHEDTLGIHCIGDLTILLQGENHIDVSVTEFGNNGGILVEGALTIQGDPSGTDSLTVIADNQMAAILAETLSVENCDSIAAAATALGACGNSQLNISNSSVTANTAPFEKYCELGMLDVFPAVGSLGPVSIHASTIHVEAGLQGIYGQQIEIVGCSTVSSAAEAFPIHTEGNLDITGSKVHAINTSIEEDLEIYMECTGSNGFGAILAANTWYDSITITNSEVVAQALHVGISGMRITIDHSDVRTDSGYFGLVTADTISIIDSSVNIGEMFTLEKAMEYGVLAQTQVPPGAIGINDYDAVLSVSNSEITIPRGVYGMVGGRVEVETSTIEIGDSVAGIYGNVGTSLVNCPSICVGSSDAMGKSYVQAGGVDIPAGIIAREGSIDITDCQNVAAEGFIAAVWSNSDSVNISNSNISADGGVFAMKNLSIADSVVQANADRTKEDAMLGCMPVALDGEASMYVTHSEVVAAGSIAGLWNNGGVIQIKDSTVEASASWTAEEAAEVGIIGPAAAVSPGGRIVLWDSVTTNGETVGKYSWLNTECTTFLDSSGVPPVSITIIPGETPDPEPTDPSEPQPTDPSEPQPSDPENVCGENLTWIFDQSTNTLTISGEGDMYDFDSVDAPWKEYRSEIRHVVLEEGVTSIGTTAFCGLVNLMDVAIAESVASIGECAFSGCSNLRSVVLPEGITVLQKGTFDDCISLESVSLPESLTMIDVSVFDDCSSLRRITIPANVTWIRSYAFFNCTMLEEVRFEGDYPQMDEDTFFKTETDALYPGNNETWTEEVRQNYGGTITWVPYGDVHEHTEVIDAAVEPTCTETGLTEGKHCSECGEVLVAQEEVPALGHSYENGSCTVCGEADPNYSTAVKIASGWSGDLTWVLTDDGVLTFSGSGAMKNYGYKSEMPWYKYIEQITSVVINEGATRIGDYAFYGMTKLETIDIADTVTYIGDFSFKGSTALDGVVLPSGLSNLGTSSFYGCTGLTSIEIPASLYTVKPYAFKNCSSLAEVTFHEGNLMKLSDGSFYGTALTEVEFPACLDIIDVYCFKNCFDLATITIPEGDLTQIREAVFYATAIPSITIPEGVTKVGPYAFKNCVNLNTVSLPTTLTSVGEASFYACIGLQGITIPDAVTSIGDYAFRKCAAMTEVNLGRDLTDIGLCAFYGCSGLTNLEIPDKVTTIQGYAFKGCTGLTSVNLGSSVETLGESAFHTCTALKTLELPASLKTIGDYCFSGSYNLWQLTFTGNAPSIGSGAFKSMAATAYYPANDSTWTSDVMQNYGGSITWKAAN